jgi:hypothetical protein
MAEQKTTVVLLKDVRFGYVHIVEPTAATEGAEKKYNLVALIPKTGKHAEANKAELDRVINQLKANVMAEPANKGKLPKKFDVCLRDGDAPEHEDKGDEYRNHWFIGAKSATQPGLLSTQKDADGKYKELDRSELRSGDYGYVTINLYSYNKAGNTGIGAGLNNLMKTRDGEPLAGRASAQSDFADVEVDNDDDTDDL